MGKSIASSYQPTERSCLPSRRADAGAEGIHGAGDLTPDGRHQPAIKGYLSVHTPKVHQRKVPKMEVSWILTYLSAVWIWPMFSGIPHPPKRPYKV